MPKSNKQFNNLEPEISSLSKKILVLGKADRDSYSYHSVKGGQITADSIVLINTFLQYGLKKGNDI